MQLMAILKDSYREARSGWVLQAMLVLSLIALIFIASISFRPTTVQDELGAGFRFLRWAIRAQPDTKSIDLIIDNYSESNPKEPWKSDYAFDFVVKADKKEELAKFREMAQMPSNRYRTERFMKQSLDFLKNVKVEDVKTSEENELRFHVTASDTKATDIRSWRHIPKFLFAIEAPLFTTSLRNGVNTLEYYLVGWVGAGLILFISVVITAGFIPSMMQKGAVDLAISKPISRPKLLIYKYLGGLTYQILISIFLVCGTWLIIGLRTGIWSPNIFFVIPCLTFYFAILYAVSTCAGILTRSTIIAILATLLAWLLCYAIGKVNNGIEKRLEREANPVKKIEDLIPRPGEKPDPFEMIEKIDPDQPLWGFIPKAAFTPLQFLHTISPRTYQLELRLQDVMARGILTEQELENEGYNKAKLASWAEILGVSFGWIVIIIGLAVTVFVYRSY